MKESNISMIEKIKKKNEELLQKHFKETFGKGHSILVNWGFPITSIDIELLTKNEKIITIIILNSLTLDYTLNFKAIKFDDDGVETPIQGSINKSTIEFVIKRVNEFNEQFFTTTQLILQDEAPKKDKEDVNLDAKSEGEVEIEGEVQSAEKPKAAKKTYVKK